MPAVPSSAILMSLKQMMNVRWIRAASLIGCLSVVPTAVQAALDRTMLWRVVQACSINDRLTGAAFPCLKVDRSGFVVLRAPLEATHIVVIPTNRTLGVEDEHLQSGDGPNLFAAAWDARHYVTETAPRRLAWDDIGLAVNSRPGRTQDQLHIHVDCVRADVRDALFAQAAGIGTAGWTALRRPLAGARYQARLVVGESLAPENIFRLAAQGLKMSADDLHELSIAVVGAAPKDGRRGFYVLIGRAASGQRNPPHGESLLDHACRA